MNEIFEKLLDKNYNVFDIHFFLSIRDIGGIYIPRPEEDISFYHKDQREKIKEALVEIDFLKHK